MRHFTGIVLVLLLALPAVRAQDKPKDGDKPQTPKEQFDSFVKEFNAQRAKTLAELQKLKGPEQQKLVQVYLAMGKEYAEKFYKLAEDNPGSPVATESLFWVLQNGSGSKVHAKAMDKAKELVAEMPLRDLARRLSTMRSSTPPFMDAVFARAEKDEKEAAAADLLAWVATTGSFYPVGQRATERLVDRHPDHAAIGRVCETLGRSRADSATDMLRKIFEKSSKPTVKSAAALGLARKLASKTDDLGDKPAEADKVAAEAEKYFVMVIDEFAKNNATIKKEAERELKALRTLRVGKEAPEIKGEDLDSKEFKLTDYRGKVVLLDFWGHW